VDTFAADDLRGGDKPLTE